MVKTHRSLEQKTIENIATILSYCREISTAGEQQQIRDEAIGDQEARIPTIQELIEGLYNSCIELEKDNQYLYVVLARVEHKLRWHEDREERQTIEHNFMIKALSKANITIAKLAAIAAGIKRDQDLNEG